MKKVILFSTVLMMLLSFTTVRVYAGNVSEIRALYDKGEKIDTAEIEARIQEETYTLYNQTSKYLSDKQDNVVAEGARDQAAQEYNKAYKNLTLYSDDLAKAEAALDAAVQRGASLEVIAQLEMQYRVALSKVTEKAQECEDWQIIMNENVVLKELVSLELLHESRRILEELRVEYDEAKGWVDVGDLFPRIPVSHGSRRFTSYFGLRKDPITGAAGNNHTGLDISAPIGNHILAAWDGTVVKSAWSTGGYGYYVIIDHGHGVHTLYAHASKNLVQVGDEVKQYDRIQESGSTGYSTGPHLHLELIIDGQYVDPYKLWKGRD